jgi:hypothetical protein
MDMYVCSVALYSGSCTPSTILPFYSSTLFSSTPQLLNSSTPQHSSRTLTLLLNLRVTLYSTSSTLLPSPLYIVCKLCMYKSNTTNYFLCSSKTRGHARPSSSSTTRNEWMSTRVVYCSLLCLLKPKLYYFQYSLLQQQYPLVLVPQSPGIY